MDRELHPFLHPLGVRKRLAAPSAPVVFGQPDVRDTLLKAELRCVVNFRPFDEFLTEVGDLGQ
jgi:hypothetical protein